MAARICVCTALVIGCALAFGACGDEKCVPVCDPSAWGNGDGCEGKCECPAGSYPVEAHSGSQLDGPDFSIGSCANSDKYCLDFCDYVGANCGEFDAEAAGYPLCNCGGCSKGEVCNLAVVPNLSSVGACCKPDCGGSECGSDGCGGICGECFGFSCMCHEGSCFGAICCEPQCVAKQCGDNGCEGECGQCPPEDECVHGRCVGPTCVPMCDAWGADCGNDGCGGECGKCPETDECFKTDIGYGFCFNFEVQCPVECEQLSKECGLITVVNAKPPIECNCGTCAEEQVCVGDNPETASYCCAPSCDGKECGDDGCGASCGECWEYWDCVANWEGEWSCVDGAVLACQPIECGWGMYGVCDDWGCWDVWPWCGCPEEEVCVESGSLTPTSSDGVCIPVSAVCGNGVCDTVEAGEDCLSCKADCPCAVGEACSQEGSCECAPNCWGRECGDDGCGGSCGSCPCAECEFFEVSCSDDVCVGEYKHCCELLDCVQWHPEMSGEAVHYCTNMMPIEEQAKLVDLKSCWAESAYPNCWMAWTMGLATDEVCPTGVGSPCAEQLAACCPPD
jgi:hypothetical protein